MKLGWKICKECGQQTKFLALCHICDEMKRYRITAFNDVAIFVECENGHRIIYKRGLIDDMHEIRLIQDLSEWYQDMADLESNPETAKAFQAISDKHRKRIEEMKK